VPPYAVKNRKSYITQLLKEIHKNGQWRPHFKLELGYRLVSLFPVSCTTIDWKWKSTYDRQGLKIGENSQQRAYRKRCLAIRLFIFDIISVADEIKNLSKTKRQELCESVSGNQKTGIRLSAAEISVYTRCSNRIRLINNSNLTKSPTRLFKWSNKLVLT
jgi:hypothetical protein